MARITLSLWAYPVHVIPFVRPLPFLMGVVSERGQTVERRERTLLKVFILNASEVLGMSVHQHQEGREEQKVQEEGEDDGEGRHQSQI